MTHASLFSGIGGPEVAAEMLGWDNLFHCEINPFGRAVLDYWFPNSKSYEDITKTDFSEWRGKVDVLTGGFPCQPFSYAGKRRGSDDDRYLWPYMFKAIDAIRSAWIVAENVAGITTMVEQGEVSTMGTQTSLFGAGDGVHRYKYRQPFTIERVCTDLEGHGYAVQPVLVPACAVGAPHRRDRVFIVARRVNQGEDEAVLQSKRTIFDTADERPRGTADGRTTGEVRGKVREEGHYAELRVSTETSSGDGLTADTCDNERDGLCRVAGQKRPFREEREHRKIVSEEGHGMDLHADIERTGEHRNASNTDNHRGREGDEHMESELADVAKPVSNGGQRNVADTNSEGLERAASLRVQGRERRRELDGIRECTWNCGEGCDSEWGDHCGKRWVGFPTVSPIHRGNDGLPFDVDRLTVPFSKWRTESLKAYGNAIVPQVIYEIFRFIEIVEKGGEE